MATADELSQAVEPESPPELTNALRHLDIRTALDRALSLPEILAQILLHLDEVTLLTTGQRVNHYWHSIIQTFPSLQQRLFFRLHSRYKHHSATSTSTTPSPTIPLNPFLPHLLTLFSLAADDLSRLHQSPKCPLLLGRASTYPATTPTTPALRLTAFNRPNASWRRMLPRAAPVHTLGRQVFQRMHIGATDVDAEQSVRFEVLKFDSGDGNWKGMGMCMADVFALHCLSWRAHRTEASTDRVLFHPADGGEIGHTMTMWKFDEGHATEVPVTRMRKMDGTVLPMTSGVDGSSEGESVRNATGGEWESVDARVEMVPMGRSHLLGVWRGRKGRNAEIGG